jgi:hypothetical protein
VECSTDNLHESATFAESYEPRPGGGVSLASRRLRCLVTDSLDRTNAGSRDGIVHPCGGEIARDKIEAKLSDPTALCGQVGSPESAASNRVEAFGPYQRLGSAKPTHDPRLPTYDQEIRCTRLESLPGPRLDREPFER